MTTLLWQKRGIHHSFNPRPTHYAQTLASLPVKNGESLGLGYEYFHLELGAVSSILINKRGVSEHVGGGTKSAKIATHDFLPKRQTESCHQGWSIGQLHRSDESRSLRLMLGLSGRPRRLFWYITL